MNAKAFKAAMSGRDGGTDRAILVSSCLIFFDHHEDFGEVVARYTLMGEDLILFSRTASDVFIAVPCEAHGFQVMGFGS